MIDIDGVKVMIGKEQKEKADAPEPQYKFIKVHNKEEEQEYYKSAEVSGEPPFAKSIAEAMNKMSDYKREITAIGAPADMKRIREIAEVLMSRIRNGIQYYSNEMLNGNNGNLFELAVKTAAMRQVAQTLSTGFLKGEFGNEERKFFEQLITYTQFMGTRTYQKEEEDGDQTGNAEKKG